MIASLNSTLIAAALAAAAAALTAFPSRSAAGRPRFRLAAAFVVAASISLPTPYGFVVAILALLASRGSAFSPGSGPGARAAIAGLIGAAAAQAAGHASSALHPLAAAAVVWAALTGTVLAVEWLSSAQPTPLSAVAAGTANIPAAALLAALLLRDDLPALTCAAALLVWASWAFAAGERAAAEGAADRAALATRNAELATIHAIGRELLSTVDPERIFSIIERECRKIFDVAFFFVGVLDRDTNEIRISYRSADDATPQELLRPLGDDLASWIVREKRSLRIDDAADEASALPFRAHVVDARVRSILATPLLVGERVIGVLSVQSRHPFAFDDHRLSVLATIAQQAAVAVENARQHALATTDSLTRLSLRDDFFRRVEEESLRAHRYHGAFSLLMLDLDAFKDMNDRHGHPAGDRYLRAVGAAIKSGLRGADVACRYGGDEFCIMLPETDVAGARPIAERLRKALARLVVDAEGTSLRTTVSIGIASYPEHDTGEAKGLLLRADSALYQAKRAGRDRVVSFSV